MFDLKSQGRPKTWDYLSSLPSSLLFYLLTFFHFLDSSPPFSLPLLLFSTFFFSSPFSPHSPYHLLTYSFKFYHYFSPWAAPQSCLPQFYLPGLGWGGKKRVLSLGCTCWCSSCHRFSGQCWMACCCFPRVRKVQGSGFEGLVEVWSYKLKLTHSHRKS
jgi:hypothetical protein